MKTNPLIKRIQKLQRQKKSQPTVQQIIQVRWKKSLLKAKQKRTKKNPADSNAEKAGDKPAAKEEDKPEQKSEEKSADSNAEKAEDKPAAKAEEKSEQEAAATKE